MHMAPKDTRPPPLARRNARRWLIVAGMLIVAGLIALLVHRLRDFDERINAAAQRYECIRLAQINLRPPAECDATASSTDTDALHAIHTTEAPQP